MHVPYIFDTTCEPTEFLAFKSSRRFFYSADSIDYEVDKGEAIMKQVCSSWRTQVVRRYSTRWLCSYDNLSLVPGIRPKRMDIQIGFSVKMEGVTESTLEDLLVIPDATSQLSTLSIMEGFGAPWRPVRRLSAIFDRAADMQAVRSFTYDSRSNRVSSDVLGDLQRSFSSLTCLDIRADRVEGSLTLPLLEILILDAESCELDRWWFPSLRHISIDIKQEPTSPYTSSHTPGPVQNIRSLLLLSPDKKLTLTQSFWEEHRSLELLGASTHSWTLVDAPPKSHPLAHLYSHVQSSDDFNLAFINLITLTAKLQTVAGFPSSREVGVDWIAFLREQEDRGVRFYGEFGDKRDYKRK
ncbi:hypothetical protein FRC17_009936 [Serendipita sp. 399]|nr:hypothetical protein FRC17_009936 [Serendipita sp. 399]